MILGKVTIITVHKEVPFQKTEKDMREPLLDDGFNLITMQPTQQEIKDQIKALQRESTRLYQKNYYDTVTKQKRREQSIRNRTNT